MFTSICWKKTMRRQETLLPWVERLSNESHYMYRFPREYVKPFLKMLENRWSILIIVANVNEYQVCAGHCEKNFHAQPCKVDDFISILSSKKQTQRS